MATEAAKKKEIATGLWNYTNDAPIVVQVVGDITNQKAVFRKTSKLTKRQMSFLNADALPVTNCQTDERDDLTEEEESPRWHEVKLVSAMSKEELRNILSAGMKKLIKLDDPKIPEKAPEMPALPMAKTQSI